MSKFRFMSAPRSRFCLSLALSVGCVGIPFAAPYQQAQYDAAPSVPSAPLPVTHQVLTTTLPAVAPSPAPNNLPLANVVPSAPQVSLTAYAIMDYASGQLLAAKNPHAIVEPASLTKMMTAYVVMTAIQSGEISGGDFITMSSAAASVSGSQIHARAGQMSTIDELLHGLMMKSGNDAAVALAEHLGRGSVEGFVERMNGQAERLGLVNSKFANPHGLPALGHYSSAYDMSKLARSLAADFPQYYPIYSLKEYPLGRKTLRNTNPLLRIDPSVDGIKTGYTRAAGYCLATSAKRDDLRLIVVGMGAPSSSARVRSLQSLIEYGFATWRSSAVARPETPVGEIAVSQGMSPKVGLVVQQPLMVTLPRTGVSLETKLEGLNTLTAPVRKGQQVGFLSLYLNGAMLQRVPVYTQEAIGWANALQRLINRIQPEG